MGEMSLIKDSSIKTRFPYFIYQSLSSHCVLRGKDYRLKVTPRTEEYQKILMVAVFTHLLRKPLWKAPQSSHNKYMMNIRLIESVLPKKCS